MAGPMQKAKRGDPLVIPAATFNTFIDAARDFQGRQRSTRGAAVHEQRDSGIVLVRNESGADRERFDVLGIGGVIITPAANLAEFRQRPALVGEVPAAEHRGRLVVLAEPLQAGAIGRAYAAGVCIARVDMLTAEQATADVKVNDPTALESSSSGALQILWVEAGTGVKWAVVRFSGGGGDAGPLTLVVLVPAGGAAGDAETACSWAYDLYHWPRDPEAEPLAESVQPLYGRTAVGAYEQAEENSHGLAIYEEDEWKLLFAFDEQPATNVCDPCWDEE